MFYCMEGSDMVKLRRGQLIKVRWGLHCDELRSAGPERQTVSNVYFVLKMLISARRAPSILVLRSKIPLMWANGKAREQKTYEIVSAINHILSVALGAVLSKAMG
jgi:hypothetical protein